MRATTGYQLVPLANGTFSVHSLAHQETFHPVIGPQAEAEVLYVRQLQLVERVRQHPEAFVVWDVGLGAAANALSIVRATRELACSLQLVSFDRTFEPLEFALAHAASLGYLQGYHDELSALIRNRHTCIRRGPQRVDWCCVLGDFPTALAQAPAPDLPRPHAVLFDAYSPASNPEMWTQPLFASLFGRLSPQRPCALATYSRSTMLRVTLLLAGFFVGRGLATGEKEETTIAANTLDLIEEPLDQRWLRRALRSTSAEPLWEPTYRQAPLSPTTRSRLHQHPQFCETDRAARLRC